MAAPEGKERERHFRCPHCEKEIVVHVQTVVQQVTVPVADDDPDHPWKFNATASHIALVEDARRSGLMEAFGQAAKDMNVDGSIPRVIEKTFLNFVRYAQLFNVPGAALVAIQRDFPGSKKVEIWQASGIAAISVDGVVRRFAPLRHVRILSFPQPRSRMADQVVRRNQADAGTWMRTRWGYVVGKGAFFEEMQKKFLGEWDKQR